MSLSIERHWRLDGMPDLAAAVDVRIPDNHAEFFGAHGFSAAQSVIDIDVVAQAAVEAEALNDSVWSSSHGSTMSERSAQRHPVWRVDEAPPALSALLADAQLAALLRSAFDAAPRIAGFEIFVRGPHTAGTHWHVDGPYIPVSGRVVHAWLPLRSTPAGRGLNFATDFGFGRIAARFVGLLPGDVAYHGHEVPHCGQTYETSSVALSVVAYDSASVLDPGEGAASVLGREEFRRRIFPDLAWGAPALAAWTPLLAEGTGSS